MAKPRVVGHQAAALATASSGLPVSVTTGSQIMPCMDASQIAAHFRARRDRGELELPIIDTAQCTLRDVTATQILVQRGSGTDARIQLDDLEALVGEILSGGTPKHSELRLYTARPTAQTNAVLGPLLADLPCILAVKEGRGTVYIRNPEFTIEVDTVGLPDIEIEAIEGSPRLVSHLRYERRRELVTAKKQAVQDRAGALVCEVCDFDFAAAYGRLGEGLCEVHHKRPISDGERVTQLDDLAILCANCHRVVHQSAISDLSSLRSIVEHRRSQ